MKRLVDTYKAQQWIRQKAFNMRCPVCQGQSFGVDSVIAMTNSIDENTRINYLSGLPLVPVTCGNCGHIMFFNAKQMGLL